MRRAENHIIASAEERKEVLTEMMQSAQVKDGDRCKAIEILNKMEGLDIRKHEVVAQLKLSPEEAERKTIEIYKGNPELWERIKSAVEATEDTPKENTREGMAKVLAKSDDSQEGLREPRDKG